MKLVFIRHGDPDYEHDGVTATGRREAELLNARLLKTKIDKAFVSPLGRAKETAQIGLNGTGIVPVEYDWLREFAPPRIKRPDRGEERSFVCWDWLPKDWTVRDRFFDAELWADEPEMAEVDVRKEYDRVCAGLDAVLAENGYERDGRMYRAVRPNNDTLVFFCHLGVMFTMIAHLVGMSPMQLWQGFYVAPTSITVLNSEERISGQSWFRVERLGDTNHLTNGGEPISSSGYFASVLEEGK